MTVRMALMIGQHLTSCLPIFHQSEVEARTSGNYITDAWLIDDVVIQNGSVNIANLSSYETDPKWELIQGLFQNGMKCLG